MHEHAWNLYWSVSLSMLVSMLVEVVVSGLVVLLGRLHGWSVARLVA